MPEGRTGKAGTAWSACSTPGSRRALGGGGIGRAMRGPGALGDQGSSWLRSVAHTLPVLRAQLGLQGMKPRRTQLGCVLHLGKCSRWKGGHSRPVAGDLPPRELRRGPGAHGRCSPWKGSRCLAAGPTRCVAGRASLLVPFRMRVNVSDAAPRLGKWSFLKVGCNADGRVLAPGVAPAKCVTLQSLFLLRFPHLRPPEGLSGRKTM